MLKTFKFISFIIALTVAVVVQATPTIPNVSMLNVPLCHDRGLTCIDGRTARSHFKLVIRWISVLTRKFVFCSQPSNVSFLMLNFAVH